jgi:hypothetical protein
MSATNGIPRSIEDVNNAWLSESLGDEVTSYSVTFLEGGVMSDAFKIHDISYRDSTELPTSVVLKMTNMIEDRRAVAMANNAYVREVKFLDQLADEVPLRTPKIYDIRHDGSDTYEFFSIVMEDLTTHSEVFDQVTDPPDEAYVRKINLEVAELHAMYWESDTLELDWLRPKNNEYTFSLNDAAATCSENIDTYIELWEKSYGERLFEEQYASLKPLTDIITGEHGIALLAHLNGKLNDRPWTLVHNDLRADNIFRTRDTHADAGELTYIDWQLVSPGPPGPEFTQAWQHTLPPEVRRKEKDFLKQYHDRLIQLAPQAAAYTYDMLIEDYRIAFIQWWMALITIGAATFPVFFEPEGARMKALWGQGLPYMFQAIHDNDCLDLVEQTLSEIR